jgi:cysteine desulfuration protein SufE
MLPARHVVRMSPSPIQQQADAIAADFSFLSDWEQRFGYIIDLGKALPELAPAEYSEANKVKGCSSQVWLVAEPSDKSGAIRFRGASDAMIVAGLVAILIQLYSDQQPADILAFDAESFFRQIGVSDALTPQRSNGLKSMLARIRDIAKAAG